MVLAVDIGNSDITIGLWIEEKWRQIWRNPSKSDQPELYYGVKIRDHFLEAAIAVDHVETIVLSSVVPNLTEKIKNVVRTLFLKEAITLGPAIYGKLPIEALNPYSIGLDLVG